jgi:hypothetical protein
MGCETFAVTAVCRPLRGGCVEVSYRAPHVAFPLTARVDTLEDVELVVAEIVSALAGRPADASPSRSYSTSVAPISGAGPPGNVAVRLDKRPLTGHGDGDAADHGVTLNPRVEGDAVSAHASDGRSR